MTARKVYSLAFFRSDESAYESPRCGEARGKFFVNYPRAVIRAFHATFAADGWELEIRHDDRVREFPYFKALQRMHEEGLLKLIPSGPAPSLCGAMLWRIAPLYDDTVERLVCRDLDALPTPRELLAVRRWEASGKPAMALADSISHSGPALMGGMCGFVVSPRMRAIFPSIPYGDLRSHGDDQRWLNTYVLPQVYSDVHFEATAQLGPKEHPLEILGAHVGGAFHVQPVVDWFSANRSACPRLAEIEGCENG